MNVPSVKSKSAKSRPLKAAALEARDDLRGTILRAALQMFSDQGFHGVAMSALARKAGVGVGSIYRYFETKEALIHALYRDIKTQMHDGMLQNYEVAKPYRARFEQIAGDLIRYGLAQPLEFNYAVQYAYSPYLQDKAHAIEVQMPQAFLDFMTEGYSAGHFKPLPAEILTATLFAPLYSLINRHIAGLMSLTPEMQSIAIAACWDAVKK
jgi:TetR/AcrR family transcriptional regulator, repressor of fatR-cypB operon